MISNIDGKTSFKGALWPKVTSRMPIPLAICISKIYVLLDIMFYNIIKEKINCQSRLD